MDTVTIIDGEEEAPKSKTPIIITAVAIIAAISGVVFGLIQKSEKDSLNTRISNLEQSVNIHVAEVEALKNQLIENNIKPNIVTTTETKTASNDKVATDTDNTAKKEDTKKDDKKNDSTKKDTAGEGYSDIAVDPGSDWGVRFYLPNGIKNLNYVYPSGNSISVTGIVTATKTYDSETCASGFGQIILGGSTGEKLYSDSKGTYYYVAPKDSKCSGTDYNTAVSLTKKLFQSIKAK